MALTPSPAAVAAGERWPSQEVIQTDVPSPADAVRMVWSRTWAFAKCIALVGVPFAIAVAVAVSPPVWAWVLRAAPLPPQVGSRIAPYAEWIKATCGHALRP
jgi:hypothetical protein